MMVTIDRIDIYQIKKTKSIETKKMERTYIYIYRNRTIDHILNILIDKKIDRQLDR